MECSAEETHSCTGKPRSSSGIHSDTKTNTQRRESGGSVRFKQNPLNFIFYVLVENQTFPEMANVRVQFTPVLIKLQQAISEEIMGVNVR